MKKIVIIAIVFILSSCGYNVKTDNELKQYEYRVESVETMLDEAMGQMKAERDSLRDDLARKQLELDHYKDSVAFMELDRVMCYTTSEHRHSCLQYK